MNEFWLYFKLGLNHVLDMQAYDHVLFIVVLVAAYNFSDWKKLLGLVSLFTLGHTISLLLASYSIASVSSSVIEFLIPITILITAFFNIIASRKSNHSEKIGLLLIITFFFGLIHGFGFATYFNMIKDDTTILPLLEFALGIEIAQIIIVIIVLIISFIFQSFLRFNKRDWILIISSLVIGIVIPMLIENWSF
ncbi:MAG: hypothetical protein ACI9SJ_000744 [Flavobacteriaceae bacterium]|jgi:hypothetical protein|uniref:HupE/UreJ family protein n=1 Tax=Candidatus Marifrigoribacter sp. Uisw_064 TaxID=3230970 RepID=UPI003AE8F29C